MDEELGKLIVKGAAETLKEITKEVLSATVRFGKQKFAKISVDFEYGFRQHLDRSFEKLSKVKTLLNPNSPASLESIYVAPNLKLGVAEFTESRFLSLIPQNKFFVITGIGGSGKSIFLRHLFVRYYNEALGRVPIFVELRRLKPNVDLVSQLANQISTVSPVINPELFEYALRAGKFILLLDGFDEVDPSFKDNLAQQIVDLSYKYGDNAIVMTSRPDGPFSSWNEFNIAELLAFKKKQVTALVSKMDYESNAKKQFLGLIRRGLYETHETYLSNPLLCTLMLLTFDQGAEIPAKMHVFFERAFEVLFYKHDATKEMSFRRKFRTDLSIDDFRSALAAFSTFCYLDYGSSFVHTQAINSAKQALEYNSLSEDPEKFLSDLCTSVSILIREGDVYNYIHRSLQEFFVAEFLAYREIDEWDSLIERMIVERPNDSVIYLLSDINRDRFEKQFLAPRIRRIRKELESIDVRKNPVRAFRLFYITFSFGEHGIVSWTVGRENFRPDWHYMIRFVDREGGVRRYAAQNEFGWGAHLSKRGIEVKDEGYSKELSEVSDLALLGTPMVSYLVAVKEAIIAMDDRLTAAAANRRRLMTSALLSRDQSAS
jgi:hypothetical protein